MLVITADQRSSRGNVDLVPQAIDAVTMAVGDRLALQADRNAGDEVQLATHDGDAALTAILLLVRTGDWAVGLGGGAASTTSADDIRAARGSAFVHARAAVDRAKRAQWRFAIDGDDAASAADAEALVRLLLELRARRTSAGWELVDLLDDGGSQQDAARALGISEAAVSLRAKAAGLRAEEAARPALGRLLTRIGAV